MSEQKFLREKRHIDVVSRSERISSLSEQKLRETLKNLMACFNDELVIEERHNDQLSVAYEEAEAALAASEPQQVWPITAEQVRELADQIWREMVDSACRFAELLGNDEDDSISAGVLASESCKRMETLLACWFNAALALAVARACHELLDKLFSGQDELANGYEEAMSSDPDDCEFHAENCFVRVDAEALIPADAQAALRVYCETEVTAAIQMESECWFKALRGDKQALNEDGQAALEAERERIWQQAIEAATELLDCRAKATSSSSFRLMAKSVRALKRESK